MLASASQADAASPIQRQRSSSEQTWENSAFFMPRMPTKDLWLLKAYLALAFYFFLPFFLSFFLSFVASSSSSPHMASIESQE